MRRLVINEMRAYRKKLVANGVACKIVSKRNFPQWYQWHFSAVAYNPVTRRDQYLVIKES